MSPEIPHAVQPEVVLAALNVSASIGLAEMDARHRLTRFGPNTVESKRNTSGWTILMHQACSPVIYLLGTAAALAVYFGELEEGAAIAAVLVLNTVIGFFTELKAARSIEALRALGSHSARVRRDGEIRMIRAQNIVPGDIVLLEAGDAVAADLRLCELSNLFADESTLTGESVAVQKQVEPVVADTRLADRACMLFKGTTIARGSGMGVVTATGLATELGQVSRLVREAEPGASPLERKLARLSTQLVWTVLLVIALILAVGLATGKDALLMIEASIALAVAVIPEGLPVVATLTLARGMWRMADRNALIERLSAVETLGATTVILTDKTGTLTENRMAVRQLWLPGGAVDLDASPDRGREAEPAWRREQRSRLLELGVLCNDASLEGTGGHGSGDPMEVALLRAGQENGIQRTALLTRSPAVHKYAFDTASKMMATVHQNGDAYLYAVKGAPESVLAVAAEVYTNNGEAGLDAVARAQWLAHAEQLGRDGLRVLACALKTAADPDMPPYAGLTLAGLIGLEDPVRADVPQAIADCREAGIRVVMVTGDHAGTARSIARAAGLGVDDESIMVGNQIERAIGGGRATLRQIGIFARVTPAEKLALVRAYQDSGDIVAMTGDGVNDAPALRQADIGIAMGLRGTDVAREAAAMILLDDAFPTIVNAIREGRVIFDNIRRFVAYLLSCNLSEVLVIGLAVLASLPLPVLPLQILYLNLVTDVFPAFALALGEGEPGLLRRPPRDPGEPILDRRRWTVIVLHSVALSAATLGAMAVAQLVAALDTRATTTVTFLTLAFAQIWHTFSMRHPRSGPFRNEIIRNPWVWTAISLCTVLLVVPPYLPAVASVMNLAPPTLLMWAIILAMSIAPLVAIQAVALGLPACRRGGRIESRSGTPVD
ncbi:cation-translocating P-type ATPase [Paraburkholderia kururiensis]|uniref:cation-translocating P-type ATPase n=1 Tax=Paraburkholderia kururiensis TaxID=984307 RepID=UPI0018F476CE|nr:cation-transporting P-type ATPase [Paraburkholderia kururiensis]